MKLTCRATPSDSTALSTPVYFSHILPAHSFPQRFLDGPHHLQDKGGAHPPKWQIVSTSCRSHLHGLSMTRPLLCFSSVFMLQPRPHFLILSSETFFYKSLRSYAQHPLSSDDILTPNPILIKAKFINQATLWKWSSNSFFFLRLSFRVVLDLQISCPCTAMDSPIISVTHQSWTFVTTDESTWTHHDHLKSTVRRLQHHTGYFPCPINPLGSAYSSLPPPGNNWSYRCYSFGFSGISHGQNHTVWGFSNWLLSLLNLSAFKFLTCLMEETWLVSFEHWRIFHCLEVSPFIYPLFYWRTSQLLANFDNFE